MAHAGYHKLIGAAAKIPIISPKPTISFSPVVLHIQGRPVPLELRVTVPASGSSLPIVLLSHGHGMSNSLSSLEGYAPLYEFWAAHGFAVLQPTHLSSKFLSLDSPKGHEMYWDDRADDMSRILDHLDIIEETVPGLKSRLDRTRVAVAGHSFGSLTACMLLGSTNTDPRNGSVWHRTENRIQAGVILAGIGNGGSDLSDAGKMRVPFYGTTFDTMRTPALVVCGDEDYSPHLTTRGVDWHADPYKLAPGPKDMLMLRGARHGLGGVSGWDAGETLDESPERLGVVQRMTWAYLRSQFYLEDAAWHDACKAFKELGTQGTVESKA